MAATGRSRLMTPSSLLVNTRLPSLIQLHMEKMEVSLVEMGETLGFIGRRQAATMLSSLPPLCFGLERCIRMEDT